jgi:protein-S-isoprenylcysteine O-methyltransferase Ste14
MKWAGSSFASHAYRYRGWYLFGYFVLLWVHRVYSQRPLWYWALGLVVAGGIFRLAAASHIGTHTSGSRLETPELAYTGPYARCRHPLYFANILISMGVLIFSNPGSLLVYCLFVFVVLAHHYLLAKSEEFCLLNAFEQNYSDYVARTPFCPGFSLFSEFSSWLPIQPFLPVFKSQLSHLCKAAAAVILIWAAA